MDGNKDNSGTQRGFSLPIEAVGLISRKLMSGSDE